MDVATLAFIKRTRPALQDLQGADPLNATRALVVTLGLTVGVVALGAWGVAIGGAGYALAACAALLMGPVHHRIGVLGHEAAHGQLYRDRRLNGVFLYLLAGGVGSPPQTYRIAHFTHHAYLGEERDHERPNYDDPPRDRRTLARWAAARLSGLEPAGRLLHLLTAVRRDAPPVSDGPPRPASRVDGRAPPPSDWIALALVQTLILAVFALTVGWEFYVLLWLAPLFTVSRTVIGLRAFVEHLRDEGATRAGAGASAGGGRLLSFDSGPLERFVLGPLFFHLHAEHHLFPRIPTWRLPEAARRLRAEPGYDEAVRRYPSYRAALRAHLAA